MLSLANGLPIVDFSARARYGRRASLSGSKGRRRAAVCRCSQHVSDSLYVDTQII